MSNLTTLEQIDDARSDSSSQVATRDTMDIATTRSAQEVQAAMVIAKKFPRDENRAFTRIMASCKRKSLADQAIYTYPRGDTTVEGPSIRLAEVLAQAWQNIDFGIIELEQRNGESSMMAYCWDLETNTRQTKIFTVRHERASGRGVNRKVTVLTDPRDVYEMTANQGARRLRACILGIIPGDIVDAAVEECNKTMAEKDGGIPLIDRVRKMAVAFGEFGVSTAMLEKRIGHKLDVTSEAEFASLRKIFAGIRDGMGSRESYFDLGETPAQRPPPPEKAPQGAAAAMQQESSAKADVPKQAPGSASPEAPAADPAPAAREEPKQRKTRSTPPPKQEPEPQAPKPEQKASRNEIADAETIEVIVVPQMIDCLLAGKVPSVKLDVTGDFAGIVYHVGGAKVTGEDGKMAPDAIWRVGRAVKAQLLGKLQKSGEIIVFVQHAEMAPMDPIEA